MVLGAGTFQKNAKFARPTKRLDDLRHADWFAACTKMLAVIGRCVGGGTAIEFTESTEVGRSERISVWNCLAFKLG